MAVLRFVNVSEEKMVSQQILTTVMTRIVDDKSADHAKPHSIVFFCFFFYHNIKDNERNLCQHLFTIENTDSDLKVHALHYANELLVRVRLSFQKLLQNRSKYRNNTKRMFGKRVMKRTHCR